MPVRVQRLKSLSSENVDPGIWKIIRDLELSNGMGNKSIEDQFSERMDVSQQRRYQLRKVRDGRCISCGQPATTKQFCEAHRQKTNVRSRERRRAIIGAKRRNTNAESYSFYY